MAILYSLDRFSTGIEHSQTQEKSRKKVEKKGHRRDHRPEYIYIYTGGEKFRVSRNDYCRAARTKGKLYTPGKLLVVSLIGRTRRAQEGRKPNVLTNRVEIYALPRAERGASCTNVGHVFLGRCADESFVFFFRDISRVLLLLRDTHEGRRGGCYLVRRVHRGTYELIWKFIVCIYT